MGFLKTFKCQSCGLSELVSGGSDCTEIVNTKTVWCDNCHTLQDAEVSRDDSGKWHKCTPFCWNCKNEKVQPWKQGEPCPKCGGALVVATGGDIIISD
jgi:transcription elongation factor Elf1